MHIWLIGATNVGKSTLFNRLIGQFRAIVTDIPGTTTDIITHTLTLDGGEVLTFFDSPGLLDFTDELPYIEKIVKVSDVLLFLIDDIVGITAKEQHILQLIRTEKKQNQTLLVINKLDVKRKESETDLALTEYYGLGFTNVIGISAKTERNLTEIQQQIEIFYKQRKKSHPTEDIWMGLIPTQDRIGLAIVGKPNAGKSTLLNTLVGKPLAKVQDIAGTTRDYLVGEFDYKGKHYLAYDTAGIKKKGSIHGIEKIAYDKTKAMLEYVRPVVVFMVDCTQGITHRDMTLLQEIHSLALPIIFALNKVDLVNPKGIEAMLRNTQAYLEFAKYLPIVPMIATTGQGVEDVMKMVGLLQKENQKRVWTRELNQSLQTEMIQRPPRFPKNKIAKILYATQIAVDAPTFVLFVNHKSRVNFAFKKWVENTIRKHFGFIGVPLIVKYRNRGENWAENGVQVRYEWPEELPVADSPDKGRERRTRWPRRRSQAYDEGSARTTEEGFANTTPLSHNPYNNKGKRKREKQAEQHERPSSTQTKPSYTGKKGSWTRPSEAKKPAKRIPPKRDSKYTNIKQAKQGKLNEMFTKVYGEKTKKSRWKKSHQF